MAGVGEVASVLGIVAFGIQTAQILQKEIDAVLGADQRIQQVVIEIQATAHFLKDLNQYLAPGSTVPRRTKREYEIIIHQCYIVFRRVIALIAKAGSKVLTSVDEYQRLINEGEDPKTLELRVKLRKLESLGWPWRMGKIEQCIADLDRLKRSLNDRLTLANTAQAQGRPLNEESDSADEGEIDDGEEFFNPMLPIVEVIEHNDSAFPCPSADEYSDGIPDFSIQNTRRKAHAFKEGSSSQQRHRRQRNRTSVEPSACEVYPVVDIAGSEYSSHYDSDSDSPQSIEIRNEQQSGRKGHARERRYRDRHSRNGKSDESPHHSCTIS